MEDLHIESNAFNEEGEIPKKYTCDGEDINPDLVVRSIPEEVQTLVLIMDDPDAPGGTFTHWVVFDIEVEDGSIVIPEDSVPGTQGKNDMGKAAYGGPCPPGEEHRYIFHVYALDTGVGLSEGVSREDVEEAMEGHVLAEGRLMGTYDRG